MVCALVRNCERRAANRGASQDGRLPERALRAAANAPPEGLALRHQVSRGRRDSCGASSSLSSCAAAPWRAFGARSAMSPRNVPTQCPHARAVVPTVVENYRVEQNRGTRPTSPQTVPRLAAKFAARPAPSAVPRFLSGVKSPTRSSVAASSNLRRARRTSTAPSVACSSLRQKPGEQLLCCSHTLHS